MIRRRRRFAGGGGYVANAVDFDGSNDYVSRDSLSSVIDGTDGIFTCFFRLDGGNANNILILNLRATGPTDKILVYRNSANKIIVNFSSQLKITSSSTFLAGSGWHSLLLSWNATSEHLRIDDADEETLVTNNGTVHDYTSGTDLTQVGAQSGSLKWNGCLSEVYFNTVDFLDFSVEANRRLFVDGDNKPVNLGSDGSVPTGNQPAIYLNGDASNFQTNQGFGGDFTVTGSLDNCDTGPSD